MAKKNDKAKDGIEVNYDGTKGFLSFSGVMFGPDQGKKNPKAPTSRTVTPDELGELTPWHVTRFYPHYQMSDLPPTPVSTIERAYEIGQKVGLKFIYAGNLPGHSSESTVCYSCGKLAVERFGYQTKVVGLEDSKCKFCGAELNFRISSTERRA